MAGRVARVLLLLPVSGVDLCPSSGSMDSGLDLLPMVVVSKDGTDKDEELLVLCQTGESLEYHRHRVSMAYTPFERCAYVVIIITCF